MPKTVPIEIFRIAHTVVDQDEVKRWMAFLEADEFDVEAEYDACASNPAFLIALAGKRCYMSFQPGMNKNVTRIRKDYVKYFDNILGSGHGSVLEHASQTMAIENVSRVFTAEMNRHRAGWAISEGSLRFIRFGENIPYWLPDSIKGESCPRVQEVLDSGFYDVEGGFDFDGLTKAESLSSLSLDERKHWSRVVFNAAFKDQESAYRALQAIWADELHPDSKFHNKKQVTSMMRRIIGLGVATGGCWTGNIRALRHVMALRTSEAAEEEILHVFSRVCKMFVEKEPLLFGDFEETPEGFWAPKYIKV